MRPTPAASELGDPCADPRLHDTAETGVDGRDGWADHPAGGFEDAGEHLLDQQQGRGGRHEQEFLRFGLCFVTIWDETSRQLPLSVGALPLPLYEIAGGHHHSMRSQRAVPLDGTPSTVDHLKADSPTRRKHHLVAHEERHATMQMAGECMGKHWQGSSGLCGSSWIDRAQGAGACPARGHSYWPARSAASVASDVASHVLHAGRYLLSGDLGRAAPTYAGVARPSVVMLLGDVQVITPHSINDLSFVVPCPPIRL